MEAEERGYIVSLIDIVIADGAFSGFTIVGRILEVRPILFDRVGINALGVDSEIDDAFLNEKTAISQLCKVFSYEPWYYISFSLMFLELEF